MAKAEIELVIRGKTPEAWAKHDAVIEAAKAYATVRWREPYKDTADQADAENISRFELLDAVEALEEVE